MVDIDVGYLSEAINDKADRDLNNTQPLARVVVQTFVDGTSGYRIWSDGYCEQWGMTTTTTEPQTITFLKNFKDTNYLLIYEIHVNSSNGITYRARGYNKTTTGFTTYTASIANNEWKASGYLAEGQY